MTQRDTAATLEWYERHTTRSQLGYNPDGMCLKICREARGLPSGWASAVVAQAATPERHRVRDLTKVRPGMVMYFDDPHDGNQFGHIVTVAAVARTVRSLADITVWSNSVRSGAVVKVTADYFPRAWGDRFQFAATWLNGEALILPGAPAEAPVPRFRPFPRATRVAWNMKVGRRAGVEAALDALAESGARLIGLMECLGHWPVIRAWAADNGWSIVTGEGDPGSSSAYLVRHNSGHVDGGTITIPTWWRGPKRKRIRGRTIVWEKSVEAGRPTLDVLVHGVWNPVLNALANRRIHLEIRRLAAINPGWDLYVRGDLNARADSRRPFSPLGTANKIGGRIIATGASVDLVIWRPAVKPGPGVVRLRVPDPVAVKGEKYGSDHPAIGTRNGAAR